MQRILWLVVVAVVAGVPEATAEPAIELLHHTPATVAVSSTVLNAKIQPEGLVDGNLATAWNSRTGDLVGSWIAFRVPAAAHVTAIKLTAGFDAKEPHGGDYFTQNYRIRRVRISRAGKLLTTADLDPGTRGLQTIPIDAPGGDFRIEVTGVVPGSRKTWRETCVSELEVWGTAPSVSPAPRAPVVKLGSLDGAAHDPMAGPFASIAAYCQAWRQPILDAHAARSCSDQPCINPPTDPSCSEQQTVDAPGAPFLDARILELDDGDWGGGAHCALFARTRAGWFPAEQVTCTPGEGTVGFTFDTVDFAVHHGKLVWHYTVGGTIAGDRIDEDVTVTCTASGDGPPACTSIDAAAGRATP